MPTSPPSGGAGGGGTVTVKEVDGSPNVSSVSTIRVSNGTLTDDTGGQVTISTSAASLTVKEVDGAPNVSGVSTIRVSNGSLADDGGGQVTITVGGGGGSVEVKEVDGAPDVAAATILRFANGTLTDDGGGQVTVDNAPAAHAIPGSHTFSGLTDGHAFRATGATSAAFEADYSTLGFVIDGGGVAITTGSKGFLISDFAGVIENATLLADTSGSIVVDVKKSTYSGFPTTSSIAASAKPTLSSAQKSQDTTLASWTTTIAAGDVLEFVVDSASTVTRVGIYLKVRRT